MSRTFFMAPGSSFQIHVCPNPLYEDLWNTNRHTCEALSERLGGELEILRDELFFILTRRFRSSQELISRHDAFRDRIFALLMKCKGVYDLPKRPPKLNNVLKLVGSTFIYGFRNTAELLSHDSSLFDSGLGERMAQYLMTRFVAGRSLREAHEHMKKYRDYGITATYAYEIEGEEDPDQQVNNVQRIKDKILEFASLDVEANERNISVKISAWSTDFHQSVGGFERAYHYLEDILLLAALNGVFVCIDVEEYQYRDATVALYIQLLKEHPELQDTVGIVIQTYLRDALFSTESMLAFAESERVKLNFRLVKGAYMEKERQWAREGEYDDPICETQQATDDNFRRVTELLLQHEGNWTGLAFGTMNPTTVAAIIELQIVHEILHGRLEFQQLFGMNDALSYALQGLGYSVRKYVPYADKYSRVIRYFNRRLIESPGQMKMIQKLLG